MDFFPQRKEVPFSYRHRNTEDDISTSSSPLSKDWELVTSCGVERMSKPDRKNEEGNSQNTWKYREKPKRSLGQSLVCPRMELASKVTYSELVGIQRVQ